MNVLLTILPGVFWFNSFRQPSRGFLVGKSAVSWTFIDLMETIFLSMASIPAFQEGSNVLGLYIVASIQFYLKEQFRWPPMPWDLLPFFLQLFMAIGSNNTFLTVTSWLLFAIQLWRNYFWIAAKHIVNKETHEFDYITEKQLTN